MTAPLLPSGVQAGVPVPQDLEERVRLALAEDIGAGDLTARLVPVDRQGRATVITRENAVICGIPYVQETFRQLDPGVRIDWNVHEGERVTANQVLYVLEGSARALLSGERTALNFLQLLSGTATAANLYASRVAGTHCRLLDTRKTIPGLRTAQKYAVRVGGGHNHRMGLFDGILIKENHIMAAGSILRAVSEARRGASVPVEVEVENIEQLKEVIEARADIAMLDNFTLPRLREGVALVRNARSALKLEASGGINLDTIREVAETGVDYVSVGIITKNVQATDLSMRFEWGS